MGIDVDLLVIAPASARDLPHTAPTGDETADALLEALRGATPTAGWVAAGSYVKNGMVDEIVGALASRLAPVVARSDRHVLVFSAMDGDPFVHVLAPDDPLTGGAGAITVTAHEPFAGPVIDAWPDRSPLPPPRWVMIHSTTSPWPTPPRPRPRPGGGAAERALAQLAEHVASNAGGPCFHAWDDPELAADLGTLADRLREWWSKSRVFAPLIVACHDPVDGTIARVIDTGIDHDLEHGEAGPRRTRDRTSLPYAYAWSMRGLAR